MIKTHPDLVYICGWKAMLEDLIVYFFWYHPSSSRSRGVSRFPQKPPLKPAWLQNTPHKRRVCCSHQLVETPFWKLYIHSYIPQLLSNDTTFQLGEFYLSVLSFCHTLFEEAPVIPAAFMFHKCKFQSAHNELLGMSTKFVHSLGKTTLPLVTNEEKG